MQREVKPLCKRTGVVGPDIKLDVTRISEADDVNGTRVKRGGDMQIHARFQPVHQELEVKYGICPRPI